MKGAPHALGRFDEVCAKAGRGREATAAAETITPGMRKYISSRGRELCRCARLVMRHSCDVGYLSVPGVQGGSGMRRELRWPVK
jgi:hypothetical protein